MVGWCGKERPSSTAIAGLGHETTRTPCSLPDLSDYGDTL